ncbi:CpsD/CapB family tyrosine-protein kinase [Lysinibacillus cavernae]|uniref:CpsD/CapB family tyrosine-protein kinase n=1 Tax=Lysinibacillus cavernae TaxID=2666135 RepID=UPI0012D93B65|nr:CpsD/CapB family tyrosine-protein kinase [Lysinibacillus cavernae]
MFFKRKTKKSPMARKLITISDMTSIPSEQYRTIRANIKFSQPNQDVKTILVTSSIAGEGKSTNAANIGVVFSQESKNILIVDADMRKPTLHHTFYLDNILGLSSVLSRQSTLQEVIQETFVEGVDIISSGPIPPNPTELLASETMTSLMTEVKGIYDLIIFDAPPLLFLSDAQILSNKCDGTILIVNTGVVGKAAVVKSKSILTVSKANILGVILNNYKIKGSTYEHYYGKE